MELGYCFLDSNALIYFMEGTSPIAQRTKEIMENLATQGFRFATSALAVGEVLVKPIESNDLKLIHTYQSFFDSGATEIVPFTESMTTSFARLRAAGLKPADSIHLACAAGLGTAVFLTNDKRLSKVVLSGIDHILDIGSTN